jgi:hypothetical protein
MYPPFKGKNSFRASCLYTIDYKIYGDEISKKINFPASGSRQTDAGK